MSKTVHGQRFEAGREFRSAFSQFTQKSSRIFQEALGNAFSIPQESAQALNSRERQPFPSEWSAFANNLSEPFSSNSECPTGFRCNSKPRGKNTSSPPSFTTKIAWDTLASERLTRTRTDVHSYCFLSLVSQRLRCSSYPTHTVFLYRIQSVCGSLPSIHPGLVLKAIITANNQSCDRVDPSAAVTRLSRIQHFCAHSYIHLTDG